MSEPSKCLVRAADRKDLPEESGGHPWNPLSELHGHRLSKMAGMQRLGVNLIRIPPGKESFVPHSHHFEEEFAFILSGRGMIEIDDKTHEIGPGDFVGFPAPSPSHHIRNPGPDDLVYLSGGENREVEIADYPKHGRRLVRFRDEMAIYPLKGGSFENPEG